MTWALPRTTARWPASRAKILEALRKSMKLAYTKRFWGIVRLSVAALKGIAASLEGVGEIDDTGTLLRETSLEELLAGTEVPPEVSRLA